MPRADGHLKYVIINNKYEREAISSFVVQLSIHLNRRDKKLASKQVTDKPFIFKSPEVFERTIRQPIGKP